MRTNLLLKCFFFLLFFGCQMAYSQAQKYIVIIGNKDIQNLKSNRGLSSISPDDIIWLETPLKFQNPQADAILMDELGKEYMIKYRADKTNPVLRDVISPRHDVPLKGSRGAYAIVSDLGTYFGDKKFFIIGDSLKIRLNKQKYPINSTQFLAFKVVESGKAKARQFPMFDDSLLISKDILRDASPASDSIPIYWVNTVPKTSSSKVAIFKPVFLEEESLKATFQKIEKMVNDKKIPNDKKEKFFTDQFERFFGDTDVIFLTYWLKKQGFLK